MTRSFQRWGLTIFFDLAEWVRCLSYVYCTKTRISAVHYSVHVLYWTCTLIFVNFWCCFAHKISLGTRFVRAPHRSHKRREVRRSTEESRPDTVVEVWARSVQCVARGVRSTVFFSEGVDKAISRVFFFFLRRYVVPGIPHFSKCWCFVIIHISWKTAPLLPQLYENDSLCRDSFGVHYHPSLVALRILCRVSHLHVPCVMRRFFSNKKGRPSK